MSMKLLPLPSTIFFCVNHVCHDQRLIYCGRALLDKSVKLSFQRLVVCIDASFRDLGGLAWQTTRHLGRVRVCLSADFFGKVRMCRGGISNIRRVLCAFTCQFNRPRTRRLVLVVSCRLRRRTACVDSVQHLCATRSHLIDGLSIATHGAQPRENGKRSLQDYPLVTQTHAHKTYNSTLQLSRRCVLSTGSF